MMDQAHHEREHFFRSAKVVMAVTILSRVFGMLRDIAMTSLGANRTTRAFVLAFRIPNLFRRLFGEGALSAAFVPVFTQTNEKDGFEKASRLLSNALALLAVTLLAILLVGYAVLLIWGLGFPGLWDRQLLLQLSAIMLPFMVTICLLALGSAALNCRGHFGYPAFAPIILNIVMIAAAWGVAPLWRGNVPGQLYVISASVIVAGTLQLAGVLWLLKRSGFALRLRLRPIEPGIGPMLKMMGPMILGLGFLQISELLNDVIAWVLSATQEAPTIWILFGEFQRPLTPAVQMRLYAAQRLYQFPMGVLAISMAVAVFPLLSRYAARGDLPNLRDSLNRALRLALMEGLAAGTGLFVLAGPITRLIFQHRNFNAQDAAATAFILQMYVLGMWAYCTHAIFLRAFYALKDTLTPLKISCALVLLGPMMVTGLVWIPQLRAGAFGVATTIITGANVTVMMIVLRRRLGRFGGRTLARSAARSAVGCAALAGAVVLARHSLGSQQDWLVVLVCVPAGAAAFFLVLRLLKAPELAELLGAVRRSSAPSAQAERPASAK